ncbi:MAG: copper resistance protein CopC [Oscillochloridaceae bacterium]|nr:copper resistance protein CopC/CopD [Chloroflexaceae bacterium]MDW8391461.1 copper resistance protein CopC [Oscillochloridaceae bacterium]
MHIVDKNLVLLALVCLGMIASARDVWAHPRIIALEPPPGARLTRAPSQVAITFNEPIEALSTLALYSSQGALAARGGERDPADPRRLVLKLPPLAPDLYTVGWTAAGSDGHVVRGMFVFTVLDASLAASDAAPAQMPVAPPASVVQPDRLPLVQSLIRWGLLLGATGAVGGWIFWPWVAVPVLGGTVIASEAVRRWRRWSAGLILAVLIGTPLLFGLYVYESTADLALLRPSLGTRQSLLLAVRMALAIALLVLTATSVTAGAIQRRAPLALLLGAALLLTFALAGHAGAKAEPAMPVLVNWLHLAATSIWAGGVLNLALALPLIRGTDGLPLINALLRRFTPLALGGAAALALSGAAIALREIPSLTALQESAYGRALLVKLLCFGAMLALGAYHGLVAGPRLRAEARSWLARLRYSLLAEGGFALLALGAAGTLTSLPPPVERRGRRSRPRRRRRWRRSCLPLPALSSIRSSRLATCECGCASNQPVRASTSSR